MGVVVLYLLSAMNEVKISIPPGEEMDRMVPILERMVGIYFSTVKLTVL
ncbi:hypothetical protein C4K14_2639 [Pseudomonas chlororaphis subsp. aureofaciens]|nr:hypothetical protein C4K14_2639 [Pseudomonas chlororaphis subsp. aureofaciens]